MLLAIQETHCPREDCIVVSATDDPDDTSTYHLYTSTATKPKQGQLQAGVGFLIRNGDYRHTVEEVSERIIILRLTQKPGGPKFAPITFVCVYAPASRAGGTATFTDFLATLEGVVSQLTGRVIVLGDLNAREPGMPHPRTPPRGNIRANLTRRQRASLRTTSDTSPGNDRGEELVAWRTAQDLHSAYTKCPKIRDTWVPYSSLTPGGVIDYIFTTHLSEITRCKIVTPLYPTDHRMVVADVWPKAHVTGARDRGPPKPPTPFGPLTHADHLHEIVADAAAQVELPGTPLPPAPQPKWMSPDTYTKIQEKLHLFRDLRSGHNAVSRVRYRAAKKAARQAVRKDLTKRDEDLMADIQGCLERRELHLAYVTLNAHVGRKQRPKEHRTILPSSLEREKKVLEAKTAFFKTLLQDGLPPPPGISIPLDPPPGPEPQPPPPVPGKPTIRIFTDGSYKDFVKPRKGSPHGAAGYGFTYQLPDGSRTSRGGRCDSATPTNNVGELTAAIVALLHAEEALPADLYNIELVTDSQYVRDGLEIYLQRKIEINFAIPNGELWRSLAALRLTRHFFVTLVPSHTGDPDNDIADAEAEKGRTMPPSKAPKIRQPLPGLVFPVSDTPPTREAIIAAAMSIKVRAVGADRLSAVTWKTAIARVRDRDSAVNKLKKAAVTPITQAAADKLALRAAIDLAAEEALLDAIVKIVTYAWETGHTPEAWRTAIIIALNKPRKSPTDPLEFRGISLLSHAGKIVARLLLERLRCLPLLSCQNGFRQKRSTANTMAIQRNLISHCRRLGLPLVTVYLDITKCYDTYIRSVLYDILEKRGVGPQIINLIKSLYEDIAFVQHGGERSEPFQTAIGLRQGCLLSPILSNIILDSVLRTALARMNRFTVTTTTNETIDVTLNAYADDTALNHFDDAAVQANLDILAACAKTAGLTFSVRKTEVWHLHLPPIHDLRVCQAAYDATIAKTRPADVADSALPTTLYRRVDNSKHVMFYHAIRDPAPDVQYYYKCPYPNCKFTTVAVPTKHLEPEGLRGHLKRIHQLEKLSHIVHTEYPEGVNPPNLCPGCPHRFFCKQKCAETCNHSRKHTCPGPLVRVVFDDEDPLGLFQAPAPATATAAHQCTTCRIAYSDAGCLRDHQCRGPPRSDPNIHAPIILYGEPLPTCTQFKHVGRIFTNTDDDMPDLLDKLKKARSMLGTLKRKVFARDRLSTKSKVHFLHTLIIYGLFYTLDWELSTKHERLLRTFQQQALRYITKMHPKPTGERTESTGVAIVCYPKSEDVLRAANMEDIVKIYRDRQRDNLARLQSLRAHAPEAAASFLLAAPTSSARDTPANATTVLSLPQPEPPSRRSTPSTGEND